MKFTCKIEKETGNKISELFSILADSEGYRERNKGEGQGNGVRVVLDTFVI